MNIRHYGITVQDLGKTERIFGALGFKAFSRGKETKEFMQKVTGQECTCEWVKLEDEEGNVIELIKYNPDIGIKCHLAVSVKRISDYAEDFGIGKDKVKVKYKPYDGVMLELVQ